MCEGDAGHGGLHVTRYCSWADEDSLSREEAGEVLRAKGPEGEFISALWGMIDPG